MKNEREIFDGNPEEVGSDGSERAIVPSESGIEPVHDPEIDRLIKLLSQPAQALTTEEYLDSIAKRQEAVSQYLLRGGPDTLRRFFEKIRQIEKKQPIKIDLSMIEISGRILSGLYLPGANLEKLVAAESDLSGADVTAANLTEAVLSGSKLNGIIATGANFRSAVLPGTDLSGGRFVGCNFINTVMTDVIVDKETTFAGCRFIGTFLGGTDLSPANRMGAVFRGLRR